MLTTNRARLRKRRGIALILILGMLGLLAFIGVTFATISGQARISGRNYAQAVMRPQPSDLMEFALSQLIGDTDDVRSAIRGHSMARDMYGNDAQNNGFVDQVPLTGAPLVFTSAAVINSGVLNGTIQCVTNVLAATDIYQPLYGYNFTRWVVRFGSHLGPLDAQHQETRWIGQTFEIVMDDTTGTLNGNTSGMRTFYLAPTPAPMGVRAGYKSPDTIKHPAGVVQAALVNQSMLIGDNWYPPNVAGGVGVPIGMSFTLDGRFLRAFNGPGMGPLAQYANMRYNGGMLAGNDANIVPGHANTVGMDEDYDACDLENWFLAIQSADGKAIIPSFHRPGILQSVDWANKTAESQSRILRPRAIDGHDLVSFPNLSPQADGTIQYDVDNDADGITDSVWVDLGYPPVRDSRGLSYKPLFAFMVVGLNGRMPLNTVGNLNLRHASGTSSRYMHASHLGYAPSEVDPTFGLQNAGGFQLDNATSDTMGTLSPVSVNVTQLRNILTGTRPYAGLNYADQNFVQGTSPPYFLPNNVPDYSDSLSMGIGALPPRSVAGRWGEASYIPSLYNINGAAPLTPIMAFPNLVRAGMSVTGTGVGTTQVADGRDDNNTTWDYWPDNNTAATTGGEFLGNALPLMYNIGGGWPADYYCAGGDTPHFVERSRRFVTPIDISGDGQEASYSAANVIGADNWGRVGYRNYFRPPGIPVATVAGVAVPTTIAGHTVTRLGVPAVYDVTNNPLHGYESHRNPSSSRITSWKQALNYAATPTSLDAAGNDGTLPVAVPNGTVPTSGALPFSSDGTQTPTFHAHINSLIPGNPGLNEPNETALYSPSTSDQIFGVEDLEWLYRAHDLDGTSLYSRLSELAPLSFRDASDALRRRRLYSIDVWDTNSFAWTNDDPGGYSPTTGLYNTTGNFNDNHRFQWPFTKNAATNLPQVNTALGAMANASLNAMSPAVNSISPVNYVNLPAVSPIQSSTPSLAHRDRKINLNYPLPVSNESTEPTRQKWIAESYQFLKAVLPPLSIDTPEELAQLSQYLVNIIDFRDPDATMTRFVNPDVFMRPSAVLTLAPDLVLRADNSSVSKYVAATDLPLVQYGMEYNPIAINEVLAYAFQTKASAGAPVGRFFIELVNTLTDAQTAYAPATPNATNASWLDLGGAAYRSGDPYGTVADTGGCWDLMFTDDDPGTRPDPFTGQIPRTATSGFYGPMPLHRDSFTTAKDVVLPPLTAAGTTAPNYFYCIGNAIALAGSELNPPAAPNVVQTWTPSFDPMKQPGAQSAPTFQIPAGVLPNDATTYPATRMALPTAPQTAVYKWVCLRRPANPFEAVSATNPMIVVDSMRFPLTEGSGTLTGSKLTDDQGNPVPTLTAANQIYSVERFQPYRGGHLVPTASGVINLPAKALDVTRYGYTEQVVATASSLTNTQGIYSKSVDGKTNYFATNTVFSTLGTADTAGGKQDTAWDRFVFNDRDFTSPAELMLVPGCPPGLFTKQFVEFAPSAANTAANYFAGTRNATPTPSTTAPTTLGTQFTADPRTFPYLVDQLFYSSASPTYNGAGTTWNTVIGPSSGGWYKMFEVFEVPSPVIGATGTVAQGVNYDWLRQDVRPGQINLNLIMDEEVFLGLVGNAGARTDSPGALQQVTAVPTSLNGQTIPAIINRPQIVTQVSAAGVPTASYPITNAGFFVGASSFLKQAFTDFLSIRHGANSDPTNSFSYMFFGATKAQEAPFRSLTYPDINFTIMRPAVPTLNRLATDHGITGKDAGVKNQLILNRTAAPYYPPAMPPRRLIQIPDFIGSGLAGYTNNSNSALILADTKQIGYIPPLIPALRDPHVGMTSNTAAGTGPLLKVTGMHPYYRSEWMQKMMNLSTVRTHQYAVWVTVGFFEVTTLGDPAMASISPDAAFDVIGREVGTINGRNVRHRAFFIVDRLKLGGFDSRSPGKYNEAVLYRKIIQ